MYHFHILIDGDIAAVFKFHVELLPLVDLDGSAVEYLEYCSEIGPCAIGKQAISHAEHSVAT